MDFSSLSLSPSFSAAIPSWEFPLPIPSFPQTIQNFSVVPVHDFNFLVPSLEPSFPSLSRFNQIEDPVIPTVPKSDALQTGELQSSETDVVANATSIFDPGVAALALAVPLLLVGAFAYVRHQINFTPIKKPDDKVLEQIVRLYQSFGYTQIGAKWRIKDIHADVQTSLRNLKNSSAELNETLSFQVNRAKELEALLHNKIVAALKYPESGAPAHFEDGFQEKMLAQFVKLIFWTANTIHSNDLKKEDQESALQLATVTKKCLEELKLYSRARKQSSREEIFSEVEKNIGFLKAVEVSSSSATATLAETPIPPSSEPRLEVSEILEELQNDTKGLEDDLREMYELEGLDDLKNWVEDFAHYKSYLKALREDGVTTADPEILQDKTHFIFIGSPGTGKTTFAKLMGKIGKRIGLLSKGHMVYANARETIGKYVGHSEAEIREMIKKARGGVLFLDEAYSLASNDENGQDYGPKVLALLISEMSDGPGDIMIILAGYPDEMKGTVESNSGLLSRAEIFRFSDFTVEALQRIALKKIEKRALKISPEAATALETGLKEYFPKRHPNFGNGRFIDRLIKSAHVFLGKRVSSVPHWRKKLSESEKTTLSVQDIEAAMKQTIASLQKDSLKRSDKLRHVTGFQSRSE